MSDNRPIRVPSSRLARLARLGSVASGIAGTAAVEGARRWSRGDRPELRDLILTPDNTERLTRELARMRGAAMKVGQLLSMDAGDLVPPELQAILARLRADADHMPPRQLRSVLDKAWGEGWLSHFKHFDPRPMAAASIGQVHRAVTKDGRDLAIKVQYPGVRGSIDSDVANVGALVRLSGLLPKGVDLNPMLEEARRQLRDEADYEREARELGRYAGFVAGWPSLCMPEVHADLSTRDVLTMSYVSGGPVEDLADHPDRDEVAARIVALLVAEIFEFGASQTDPNFANYRYDPEADCLVLLDFGAVRDLPETLITEAQALLRRGLADDREGAAQVLARVGAWGVDTAPHHRAIILDMVMTVFDAIREDRPVDFGDPALRRRLHDLGMGLGADGTFIHVPPIDALFLQRKIAGTYLLLNRLGASVNVRAALEPYL
ncbi:ABC1 kinase family protein [Ovoidimarina sediminis]|uniref:ABC1 kinase family protein n=1 Tax=Ovoidimarina sediminis TaxID=3079856 RepID=UPI002930D3E0|nr:AarF/ABC1/UbiB kinase family protein [Rhodophyticola sp. MJ-SS7]